jgi:hypothetical protein
MAPPSGVVDGEARWFSEGQMTTDPGLERTDFGIPANCAGAEPGVYCDQGSGLNYNFWLTDLLDNIIGTATYIPASQLWGITNNDGDFAGNMMCYNYGTVDEPLWGLTVVSNLWGGFPGQFKPYPFDSVGPVIGFQSITTTIGPTVGFLVQQP